MHAWCVYAHACLHLAAVCWLDSPHCALSVISRAQKLLCDEGRQKKRERGWRRKQGDTELADLASGERGGRRRRTRTERESVRRASWRQRERRREGD
eukprot:4788765-Pleurochrysis_carterae.AAC.1